MKGEQTNAVIVIDAQRLNAPLKTLHARRMRSFRAEVKNAPADVTAVFLRVFKTDESAHFDLAARARPDGTTWTCRIPAACFPDAGEARYEVHATDAENDPTALGAGRCAVEDFSLASSVPTAAGAAVTVAQVSDANGAQHTLNAVLVDGEWTLQIGG